MCDSLHEAQLLRYRAHDKLMHAFVDEEVYDGLVRVERTDRRIPKQASLLDD